MKTLFCIAKNDVWQPGKDGALKPFVELVLIHHEKGYRLTGAQEGPADMHSFLEVKHTRVFVDADSLVQIGHDMMQWGEELRAQAEERAEKLPADPQPPKPTNDGPQTTDHSP